MFIHVVTPIPGVLRICVAVLRDATVLWRHCEPTGGPRYPRLDQAIRRLESVDRSTRKHRRSQVGSLIAEHVQRRRAVLGVCVPFGDGPNSLAGNMFDRSSRILELPALSACPHAIPRSITVAARRRP